MARCRSTRCARTERTGAGAPTSRRPNRTRRILSRWAVRPGPRRSGRSCVLLLRCVAGAVAAVIAGTICPRHGQPDPESRVAWLRLDLDVAVMPAHDDPRRNVQAKPGTLADRLGCEERLEDPALNLIGYARAGVGELHQQPI